MRRFEFIQGNQAKFWEVTRRGASLTVSSGRIGGVAKTRTKQLVDYMAAEQEFDRLIRDKLRRGYVEVHGASEPDLALPDRTLRLRPIDGTEPFDLRSAATRYLLWRMIEVGAMDRQVEPPDLARWAQRASRRLRLDEVPEEESPAFHDYWSLFLDLSEGDRSSETGQLGTVGAYKFTFGSHWVVTGREAGWLGDAGQNRTPRRHKVTANQQSWLDEWIMFHNRVAGTGGYTVEAE